MNVILRISRIAFGHKLLLGLGYLTTAGALAAYLFLPRLFGRAIDEVAKVVEDGEIDDSKILVIFLLILGVSGIRGVLSFGQTFLSEALGQHVSYDLRSAFYDRVQHMSFEFHDRYHTGNLMSRAISDVEHVRMFINMGLVRTPYFAFMFVFVSVILIRMNWALGLMSIGFMPLLAIQAGVIRLRMRRIWLSVQEHMAELNMVLQENLSGVRVVKAFAAEQHEEDKFDGRNLEVTEEMVSAERLRTVNSVFMMFVFLIAMGIILWYGGYLTINGRLTIGELAQFLFYMQILAMPVRMSGLLVNSFARAASAGQRLFEILDAQSSVAEKAKAREMHRVKGHVRFEGVSFGYENGPSVLKNVDLEVEPSQVVALLGGPGSGKTTIINLLPRFYDVSSGRITIDGMDVADASLDSLRRNIGMVQQDVFLFTSSIWENIAYGRHDASEEDVVAAARVAQLEDFILSLDKGYETVIGERGSTLSGGQRQRLAIARAVLLDPPVLILDDSTSSVDASTEERIRQAMESVMKGRTTFVIAHRLSTVHRADLICVLKDGEIVERGTHQELLARSGLYREIYELQLRPQEEVMLEFEAPKTSERGRAI